MKKSEVFLIFSSYKEANSFIYQSGIDLEKIRPDYFTGKYKDLNIKLYISGIGEEYTEIFLNKFNLEEESIIVKAGTAAIIDPDMDILNSFVPQIVCFEDKMIDLKATKNFTFLQDLINDKIINKRLLTTKLPLINKEKAMEFFDRGYSFIDMETFYFIDRLKENFILPLLVGTDRGDCNAKKDFLKNISKASEILKDSIMLLLKKILI
ncbi:MAG TPA: hypothetical protein PLE45_10120 [Spirochaetota bacterium]|mgnify:CR=1 FL=1|nr:hypothetical protein [Spirochaetota bacterium]HOL57480.1 hypothetical protein [Spirochaetota bacterium]HPP05037.1 hypothetical protein [Spirochaetota bacterium]